MNVKRKMIIKYLMIFLIVFVISFLYKVFIFPINGDEIWNYGFSYNISKGMIIYRDFNVLQTPLYFFVGSIFIIIFGDYLVSMHIFDCIVISILMITIIKKFGLYKSLIFYPILLFDYFPTYSYFCLFLLFIIIFLLDREEDYDDIIAFIVGLIFVSKQSIGMCLFLPLLFYSKKKIRSIIVFMIPFIVLCIYLFFNDALFDFFNYCFLGMIDFNNSNREFSIFTVLEIFVCIYLIVMLIRSKFSDKKLMFILMFQINVYPIFDAQHFIICFIPVLYCLFSTFKIKNHVIYYKFLLFIVVYSIFFIYCFKILFSLGYDVSFDKNRFWYLRNNTANSSFVNKRSKVMLKYINDYDKYFIIMGNSYFYKLYNNLEINKFDMMNDGNMGYNGSNVYVEEIDDICKNNSCVFFVDDMKFDKYVQFSSVIYNYIHDNYNVIDDYDNFKVYDNGIYSD